MFRTELTVAKAEFELTLQDKVVTIGSCFAEVIGSKLQQHKVDVLANPFGTIFNPVSVCKLLQAACGKPYNFEQHLVEANGIWYAYDLHSSISSPGKVKLLQLITDKLTLTKQYLQSASLLIVTLGTAIAYELVESRAIVANCHKLPAKKFNRILLPLDKVKQQFTQTLLALKQLNPKLKVLLTVSPVRHVKETLTTNSVSKAELRLLCHYLEQEHADVLYFPAFELMMDDLRDYRFYKDDLLHPTSMAENYIWEKFTAAYYSSDFQRFIQEWDKMKRALAHRPFHPASAGHQQFLANTQQQLEQLAAKYKIDAAQELATLRQQQVACQND